MSILKGALVGAALIGFLLWGFFVGYTSSTYTEKEVKTCRTTCISNGGLALCGSTITCRDGAKFSLTRGQF